MNTFQAILVTDGVMSFVMFNFYNLTWTTASLSGGDVNGLGGTEASVKYKVSYILMYNFYLSSKQ